MIVDIINRSLISYLHKDSKDMFRFIYNFRCTSPNFIQFFFFYFSAKNISNATTLADMESKLIDDQIAYVYGLLYFH